MLRLGPNQNRQTYCRRCIGGDDMKKNLLKCSLVFAGMLVFNVFVLAQHGAAGGGAGRPRRDEPGSAGAAAGMGTRSSDAGLTGMRQSSIGSHSTTTLL